MYQWQERSYRKSQTAILFLHAITQFLILRPPLALEDPFFELLSPLFASRIWVCHRKKNEEWMSAPGNTERFSCENCVGCLLRARQNHVRFTLLCQSNQIDRYPHWARMKTQSKTMRLSARTSSYLMKSNRRWRILHSIFFIKILIDHMLEWR